MSAIIDPHNLNWLSETGGLFTRLHTVIIRMSISSIIIFIVVDVVVVVVVVVVVIVVVAVEQQVNVHGVWSIHAMINRCWLNDGTASSVSIYCIGYSHF